MEQENIEKRKEKPEMYIYENGGSIETPAEGQVDGHIIEYKYLVDCIFKDQLPENTTFEDEREALGL